MHEQVYECSNAHNYQHIINKTLNAKKNKQKHVRDEWVK